VRQLEDQLRQAICGEISLESLQVKDKDSMSITCWIALLTQEEFESAWLQNCDRKKYFHFGDINNNEFKITSEILMEIAVLKPEVDDVVTLLRFLFLQGSESQQLDMFERFLAANLGKGKIVHFWSE
jgi:hypothetical protein